MTDRVALVTGGGRGIGAEVCRLLKAQDRQVAVVDLLVEGAEAVAAEVGGRAYHCDVSDSARVAATVQAVASDLGPVEILVNAAGWDRFVPFLETDEDFWDRVIEINYKGVLRTVHAVLPGMIDQGFGRIVNLASDAARVGSSLESVYSGAKAGVVAFTKTIAREAAREGVTANVVAPGPTNTQLLTDIGEAGDLPAKIVSRLARAVPMGRLAEPDEVAYGVVCFTAEDAGFITGQTLSVSGGLTMA